MTAIAASAVVEYGGMEVTMIMQNQLAPLRTRAGAVAGYSVIGIILIALAVIGILYLFGRA